MAGYGSLDSVYGRKTEKATVCFGAQTTLTATHTYKIGPGGGKKFRPINLVVMPGTIGAGTVTIDVKLGSDRVFSNGAAIALASLTRYDALLAATPITPKLAAAVAVDGQSTPFDLIFVAAGLTVDAITVELEYEVVVPGT